MKNFYKIVLLIMLICFVFCCCSNSNKLTITFADNSTEKMFVDDIFEIEQTDGRKYDQISKISGNGTITDVKYNRPNGGQHWEESFGIDYLADLFITVDDNILIWIELETDENGFLLEFSKKYKEQFYNGDTIMFEGEFQRINEEDKLLIRADKKDVLPG